MTAVRGATVIRPQKLRDRVLLGAAGMVPGAVARHLLFLLQTHPALADKWGYHIRPIHYYEPLPDFRAISEARVRARREPPEIDFDLPAQVALLERLGRAYRSEIRALADDPSPSAFNFENEYFSGIDAAVYYALIRDLAPARVVEVGSGYSTRIAHLALERNRAGGRGGELTCIEPYPQPRLTDAAIAMRLIQRPVEDIELAEFRSLKAGDILFIDSSHAVKFGGDVCREVLDILPRLNAGVWIHVHDIFFPHDYPAEWLIDRRLAFTEQYLIEAFLSGHSRFSVRLATHWLCLDHPAAADALCPPQLRPPGALGSGQSLWIQKTA